MKKVVALIIGVFLSGSFAKLSAQEIFNKDSPNVIQATIGFPQLYGPGYSTTLPALTVAYDRCIIDGLIDGNASIGVGGFFGIAASGTANYDYFYFGFGARGTFHYQFVDNLDTYAGVMVGGVVRDYDERIKNTPYPYDKGGPLAGGIIGARYYFSNTFAVVAEMTSGVALLNAGVSFRF